MKFGTFVPQGWRMDLVEIRDPIEQYEAMTAVGKAAEAAGYDSIWVYDHFHTVPKPEIETCFEAWTITAALSRDTSTVKIGQMVTCNGYRNPAVLAKMASTVDVMSRGRLLFGLGAGWYEHEWRAYFNDYPEIPERMGAFREACELITTMWTNDVSSFKGKYYTIDGAINVPRGVQTPHIPMWIGGGGEKVTLKLVAKWGAASNFGGGNVDTVKHKMAILQGHCDKLGRDIDTITRSTNMNIFLLADGEDPEKATEKVRGESSLEDFRKGYFVMTADELVAHIEALGEAGINYLISYFPRVAYDHSQMIRFAEEVLPKFS